eukprot:2734670-Alexandrium_andersonii.AAC.1
MAIQSVAAEAAMNLNETVCDGKLDYWEVCCAPASRLAEECSRIGLRGERISVEGGYDLTTTMGATKAIERIKQEAPQRVWSSVPRAAFCPWREVDKLRWGSTG